MAQKKTPARKAAPAAKRTRGSGLYVEMEPEVRKRLKDYSDANGVIMRHIVNEAVDEYLKKRGA